MNTIAAMGFLANRLEPTEPAPVGKVSAPADVLAKKAAQARARRAKKRAAEIATAKDEIKAAKAPPAPKPAPVAKLKPPLTPKQIAKVVARAKKPLPRPGEAGYKAPTPKAKAAPAVKKPKSKMGGAREGAGRKSLYGKEIMRTISFKGTAAQHAEFIAAGAGAWARAGLDERLAFKAKKGGK